MALTRRGITDESGGGAVGVFAWMMEGLSSEGADRKTVMIDATYLKPHRTASSLAVKWTPWVQVWQ